MTGHDEFVDLRVENARLTALLDAHGIAWRLPPTSTALPVAEPVHFSTAEKIEIFRKLFRGRTDVYPTRWESRTSGKSGYTPACANEWRSGVCEKPRIKCGECAHRVLLPLTDAVIYKHLAGEHTVGVYPLLEEDTCHFLAVDFDEAEWREDALGFMRSCKDLGVPAALEISRSGKGAHAWIFFASTVASRDARRLGTAIISHTCARTRQLELTSYDRLFPNQDTMPKGGFGNLIALPLQKKMQSLSRQGEVNALVENYGQVIVDECHHVGAKSFDAILRRAKAKYVLGLTATPIRRDGQQAIIFMQCGPIRHKAAQPADAPHDLAVVPRINVLQIDLPPEAGIQDVFRHLAQNPVRTDAIASEVIDAFRQGRKVLVLTERTEHLDAIREALSDRIPEPFPLHGRMSKKQRSALIAALDALPPNVPRVLLATGKLVGEGFDHPPLDTLVLAMPISWKGTLQQYAGRLHRVHAGKIDVRIIDFVDTGHPALLRMWDKRQRGYRAMGYRI